MEVERPFKFLRVTRDRDVPEGDVFKRGVKIVSGHGSRQIPLKGNLLIIIGLLTHLAGERAILSSVISSQGKLRVPA